MDRRAKIGLDNTDYHGRLRSTRSVFVYDRPHAGMQDVRKVRQKPKLLSSDIAPPNQTQTTALTVAQLSRKFAHSQGVIDAARAAKKRPDLPRQSRSNVLKRHAVKTASKKYRPKHRRPLMPTLLSALAIALFAVGLLAVFSSVRTDRLVKAQVGQLAAKSDDDDGISDGLPSEDDPPMNIDSYSVAADLPKFLAIEKLDVNARVRRLGVGTNNVLKAPSNIFDVGWYDGSAKPGENGTVVMDGHVSGPTKHGVFYSIGSLKPNDKISVERGDGKVFTYSVTGSQIYDNDKVDMAKVMTSSVSGKPALNLITCAGRFNVRTNQFEQRVVVFAVLDS